MDSVADRLYQRLHVRREISQPPDLAVLLLARLMYQVPAQQPRAVGRITAALEGRAPLVGVTGAADRIAEFGRLLGDILVINRTVKGTTYQPVHPALALATNGEAPRVQYFLDALAGAFTPDDAQRLRQCLWSREGRPDFEVLMEHVIAWQLGDDPLPGPRVPDSTPDAPATAVEPERRAIMAWVREDLLALAQQTVGVLGFVTHAGRLLSLALAQYVVAGLGIDTSLPIYAAPASDSHEGVRALAHEIIEVHRAQLAEALRHAFHLELAAGLRDLGLVPNPVEEETARQAAGALFTYRNRVVPRGQWSQRLEEHDGTFADVAYAYYWTQSGASNRFLRQQHAAYVNMAKKAGVANSRSRYSHWHYYWLAPPMIETLVLATQARRAEARMLVSDLLEDWRNRYRIAVLVDDSWRDAYRRHFPAMGSPHALDEANRRRLTEVLAERGRLHKNSDDYPWVLLRA